MENSIIHLSGHNSSPMLHCIILLAFSNVSSIRFPVMDSAQVINNNNTFDKVGEMWNKQRKKNDEVIDDCMKH